eukprot:gb/GECG01010653.1/.p1 GENE.gb/GECG01010653.1/~~gb/GECG01010653.1/.p1  ORF type:complete len:845 (+),score=77.25 gb/GECG01010653.1/:1-2535(+)
MSGNFRPIAPAQRNNSTTSSAFMSYPSNESQTPRRQTNASMPGLTNPAPNGAPMPAPDFKPYLKKRILDDLIPKTTIRSMRLWNQEELATYFTDHILRRYNIGSTIQMSDEQLKNACERCYKDLLNKLLQEGLKWDPRVKKFAEMAPETPVSVPSQTATPKQETPRTSKTTSPKSGDNLGVDHNVLLRVFQNLQGGKSSTTGSTTAATTPAPTTAPAFNSNTTRNLAKTNDTMAMTSHQMAPEQSGRTNGPTSQRTDILPAIKEMLELQQLPSEDQKWRRIRYHAISASFLYCMKRDTFSKDLSNFPRWAVKQYPDLRNEIQEAYKALGRSGPHNLLVHLMAEAYKNMSLRFPCKFTKLFLDVITKVGKDREHYLKQVAVSVGTPTAANEPTRATNTAVDWASRSMNSGTTSATEFHASSVTSSFVSGSDVRPHYTGSNHTHGAVPANLKSSMTTNYKETPSSVEVPVSKGQFLESVRRSSTQTGNYGDYRVENDTKMSMLANQGRGGLNAGGLVKKIDEMKSEGINPFDPFYCLCHQFSWSTLQAHITSLTEKFSPHISPKKINKVGRDVVNELMQKQDSGSFQAPVDPIKHECPDYYEKIPHPIDLGTIKKRTESGYYKSFKQLRNDIKRIWDNAMTYNGEGHPVYMAAVNMDFYFREECEKRIAPEERKQQRTSLRNDCCTLCYGGDLEYQPPQLFCNLCERKIRENQYYHTDSQQKWHVCRTCFKKKEFGDPIKIGDVKIEYNSFQRRKNSASVLEPWVECDVCERWQHMCCALFNGKRAAAASVSRYDFKYACPHCTTFYIRAHRKQPDDSSVPMAGELPNYDTDKAMEMRVKKFCRRL